MATPVFCCGFECGVEGVTSHPHFFVNGTTQSFSTTTVRSGIRSGRVNTTSEPGYFSNSIGGNFSHRVGKVYVRFATLPNANCPIFTEGGTKGGAWFKSSDNKIYAGSRASVTPVYGSTGISVTTGVWYRIDIYINRSVNDHTIVDVQVDGSACGQNDETSGGSGTGGISEMVLGSDIVSVTADMFFDDFIYSNTAADYPLGAGKVDPFVPTADGTHNVAGANDFEIGTGGVDITNATTTAYQLVDDVPLQSGAPGTTDFINMVAPPNATDYVECVFGPAPGISTPTTAPRAVEVIAGIAQASTQPGNMEIRLNDNGTTDAVYSATGVAGVTTIAFKRKHYAAGPAGAWVIGGGGNGDFTDLRVRFGSPAALDVNPDQYFTGIMIEAEFEEIEQVFIAPKPYIINQAVNRAATY